MNKKSMHSETIRRKGVFLGLGGIGFIILTWMAMNQYAGNTTNEAVFQGVLIHDFGVKAFGDKFLDQTHVFELTNQSSETVIITKIVTTCGCTTSSVDKKIVPPGETVMINAILKFTGPGTRSAKIYLNLEDHEPCVLVLRGTVTRKHEYFFSKEVLTLSTSEPRQMVLTSMNQYCDGLPPPPRLDAIAGIDMSFAPWQPIYGCDSLAERPSRWQTTVEIQVVDASIAAPRDELVFEFDDGEPISVNYRIP